MHFCRVLNTHQTSALSVTRPVTARWGLDPGICSIQYLQRMVLGSASPHSAAIPGQEEKYAIVGCWPLDRTLNCTVNILAVHSMHRK